MRQMIRGQNVEMIERLEWLFGVHDSPNGSSIAVAVVLVVAAVVVVAVVLAIFGQRRSEARQVALATTKGPEPVPDRILGHSQQQFHGGLSLLDGSQIHQGLPQPDPQLLLSHGRHAGFAQQAPQRVGVPGAPDHDRFSVVGGRQQVYGPGRRGVHGEAAVEVAGSDPEGMLVERRCVVVVVVAVADAASIVATAAAAAAIQSLRLKPESQALPNGRLGEFDVAANGQPRPLVVHQELRQRGFDLGGIHGNRRVHVRISIAVAVAAV
mmetsp:Transcript_6199/g.13362  ORF Transcript_6199/g.13362 Transcript_6199/m.13362 type:complete len:267 (+) Transcript_6199:2-802(+)